mgnify:FL=1
MVFLLIIAFFVYFLVPFGIITWLCYDVYEIDVDPTITGSVIIILELALFVQICFWIDWNALAQWIQNN